MLFFWERGKLGLVCYFLYERGEQSKNGSLERSLRVTLRALRLVVYNEKREMRKRGEREN